MQTTKKLGWMTHVSIFWAFPPLWGTMTSVIFCLLSISTNQGLIPAAVISTGLLKWKQRQNLHPVCCVSSPYTLSLSPFLFVSNVSSCCLCTEEAQPITGHFAFIWKSNPGCSPRFLILSYLEHHFKQEPHVFTSRQPSNFILHRNLWMHTLMVQAWEKQLFWMRSLVFTKAVFDTSAEMALYREKEMLKH